MNNFFDSEIIQEEISEINRLQQEISETMFSFDSMDKKSKINHIEKLQKLLEKQRIMYTRLSLSNDESALEMKRNLEKSIQMMGYPPNTDMQTLFKSMDATIEELKIFMD
jgi:hypothetical protein